MKLQLLFLLSFSILLTLFSCSKEPIPKARYFPFPSKPELKTNNGNEIEFSGELIHSGNENILEHGFMWKVVDHRFDNTHKDSIIIQGEPNNNSFKFSSDILFGKGFDYEVKSFVKTTERTVYSPPLEFTSNGTQKNPWRFGAYKVPTLWLSINGVPINVTSSQTDGYAILDNRQFFKINEEDLTFEPKAEYPDNHDIGPSDGNITATFSINEKKYSWQINRISIFVFDEINNFWSSFPTGSVLKNAIRINTKGFSYNNQGYFVDKGFFFKSSEEINDWQPLSPIPSEEILLSAFVLNESNEVIAITNDKKIWKYNLINEGEWEYVSTIPFEIGTSFLGQNIQNKIIMGPSVPSNESTTESFWHYDITSNNWIEIPNFPIKISLDHIIRGGQSPSLFYFGIAEPYNTGNTVGAAMWSLDVSKI